MAVHEVLRPEAGEQKIVVAIDAFEVLSSDAGLGPQQEVAEQLMIDAESKCSAKDAGRVDDRGGLDSAVSGHGQRRESGDVPAHMGAERRPIDVLETGVVKAP